MAKNQSKQKGNNKPFEEVGEYAPEHFVNRELSWLQFNLRVLHEAGDCRNPLFERLKFLQIFTTNLDEFIMKRVGGFKRQIESSYNVKSSDGLTPHEQIKLIRPEVIRGQNLQFKIYRDLVEELQKNNIFLMKWSDVKKEDKDFAHQFFVNRVFPVLTPLSVDSGHPFPFISNLSYSLGITLKHPNENIPLFSRLKIPKGIPFWIELPNNEAGQHHFISLEDLIVDNLAYLFPGMQVMNVMPFKVTRNADYDHDDEDAADLLEKIEESIRERHFAECVRLEYPKGGDPWIVSVLREELNLDDEDIYELDSPFEYSGLTPIIELDRPQDKYVPWAPLTPKIFLEETGTLFNIIHHQDILVHHPYESFSSSVERFITQAAEDPHVLAIKMTLYRTGDDSPFVKALMKAAESGKQVVCLIELKARFDEKRNIYWAHKLEDAGVHVVYGIVGLKTHSKLSLIVRQEHNGEIMSYAHIGTGNYHAVTSRFYTDFGLLTSRKEITGEVMEIFNYLTGRSLKTDYKNLLVAPINMKSTFLKLIQQEIRNKKEGKPAKIFAKMNSLEDVGISEALYSASRAGVEIVLYVRGFCCLRPGVPGLSENIKIYSVIGRFLEHSRIFYFANGEKNIEDGTIYIGSADWMYRNLHNRVEVITPILDIHAKKKIVDFMNILMNDHRQCWEMKSDGSYAQRVPHDQSGASGTHQAMMKYAQDKEKLIWKK